MQQLEAEQTLVVSYSTTSPTTEVCLAGRLGEIRSY